MPAAEMAEKCPRCGHKKYYLTSDAMDWTDLIVHEIDGLQCLRAQLASLQQENERLKGERFAPMGDNHHNAALCPYCGEPLRRLVADLRDAINLLENIVCTKEPDRGVVMLSNEGRTHYDAARHCQVYDHENFSPLGDALIALHDRLTALLTDSEANHA